MTRQPERVLEAEQLPTPPGRLGRTAAAGWRENDGCEGWGLPGGDKEVNRRQRDMTGEGLLTTRRPPQLPGHAPAMPQLNNAGRALSWASQEDPRSTPPQAVPAHAGDIQDRAVLRTGERSEEGRKQLWREREVSPDGWGGQRGSSKTKETSTAHCLLQMAARQHVPWFPLHRVPQI